MHIYVVYINKKQLCVYVLPRDKKQKKHKVCLTNFYILSLFFNT